MKQRIFTKTELFRCMAILLLALCGYAVAGAQNPATQEDVNTYIINSPVPVTFTNDAGNPWYIMEKDNGEKVLRVSTDNSGDNWETVISFSYTSQKPTHLSYSDNYSTGNMYYRLDGNDTWDQTYMGWLFLPAGTHTIYIKFQAWSWYSGVYAEISKFEVIESKDIDDALATPESLPIKFTNDSANPWFVGDGYIESNGNTSYATGKFTIDKPCVLALDLSCYWERSARVIVDEQLIIDNSGTDNYYNNQSHTILLETGTHTIVFEGSGARIENVCLTDDFYDVKVGQPGEFGPTLVSLLDGKKLSEAELVRISGELNANDWLSISQLSNVKCIDMTNAKITEIPYKGFYGLNSLAGVIIPYGVITIGQEAFVDTRLCRINIPGSVKRIEYTAFRYTPLQVLTFDTDSSLKYIGSEAFSHTNLREVIMPDSVEELGGNCFSTCRNLEKMHISKSLTRLPHGFVGDEEWSGSNQTYGLKTIDLPEGLIEIGSEAFRKCRLASITIPKNVKDIGSNAFVGCRNLKEITLNSHTHNLRSTFADCNSIQIINLPCAVPPAVNLDGTDDPFNAIDKGEVNLYVPAFALYDYRMDPYWFQFIKMKSSTETTFSDYWAIYGHLKLTEDNTLPGNPTVQIAQGGILDVAPRTKLDLNNFVYDLNESAPAVFLNESSDVSAKYLTTNIVVDQSDRWYFFSPTVDTKMSDLYFQGTLGTPYAIRYYDGARRFQNRSSWGNWIDVPADGTLKRGQGYILQAGGSGALTIFAPDDKEQKEKFFDLKEYPLTLNPDASLSSEDEDHGGWQFLANPYPAFYDIYHMKFNGPITVWDGSTYRSYSLTDDNFVLAPHQPFFVQLWGGSGVEMPRSGRQATKLYSRQQAPMMKVADPSRLRLDLEILKGDNDEADDHTRVVLNEAASLAFEGATDASKIMSMNEDMAQLYTIGENAHALAINERPYADGNVALGVLIPAAGQTYRISASRADRLVWIYDAVEGIEQDLTAADYMFTSNQAGLDEERFSIRFAPETSAVGSIGQPLAKVKGGKGMIAVTAAEGAAVYVYAADGSMVASAETAGATIEMSVPAGVYIVKVEGKSFKTIVK